MRVVIVTRNMWGGGAERVIAELVKYFSFKKNDCHIITIDEGPVYYEIPNQVKIHPIGKISKKKYFDKFLRYKAVRKQVKHLKPDIVLSLPEEIGIFVIPSLLGLRVPIVISERNNPWVMPWKKGTRFLRKVFYPLASGIVFQTEEAASYFSSNIRKKGIVLPNPLDISRIPLPWDGERRKEIIGAGRLDSQKNFPLLIKSFTKFYNNNPEYKLIIYGEGKLRKELEKLACSLLPKSAYSFPGKTTALLEKMNGASMFVLSSDFEGMPNVVIEAMAMGMPVISTDCPSGGSAELIQNDKNGLLVPVGDIDSLALAMSKIAESDDYANKIGTNARKIKDHLDSRKVAEKWREYLEKNVNGRRRSLCQLKKVF